MSPAEPASIVEQKAALRKGLIARRPATQPEAATLDAMTARIETLLPRSQPFQLTAYLPIRRELDPLPLAERLSAFPLALPRTPEQPGPLDFRLWSPGDPLDNGLFNTREPPVSAPEVIAACLVVLLPLVGFDADCFRLGYGGGFYDRTLSLFRAQGKTVIALGLAYDSQLVEGRLPVEPTDEQLQAVITPNRLYVPGTSA